jgi:hypothetical protein
MSMFKTIWMQIGTAMCANTAYAPDTAGIGSGDGFGLDPTVVGLLPITGRFCTSGAGATDGKGALVDEVEDTTTQSVEDVVAGQTSP